MKTTTPPSFSPHLLRLSLPVLLSALICVVLLHHLPAIHPSQAAAVSQVNTIVSAQTTVTPGLEIILEQPVLTPLALDCKVDAWYPIPSGRDTTAYLTLNVDNLDDSTNSGAWRPNLPARGYYRIEAYIPIHDPIAWCTSGREIPSDTTEAHYTIQHALGSSEVIRSQVIPITTTRWVSLGEFLLPAGTAALVHLTDLNGDVNYSHTVSFSAMRFTYLRAAPEPAYLPFIAKPWVSPPLPPTVVIRQGQGFDVCIPPPLDKMQTWWNASPYQAYGLYLGGISYAAGCTLPTSSWVAAASQQGWQFMPIWVGPQAPCYGYRNPMSLDPAIAYQQGRSEAVLASTAARSFGLANQDLGGTLIYYNLEAYGTTPTTACQTAVEAFINGWTERLHELGNAAGVYAATCASHPTDLATLPNTPEYLWGASWYLPYSYDEDASVFGMLCLSDSLWSNHQRIRQYTGGHEEIWGGAKLLIDSNVIDGAVLQPTLASRPAPVEEDASAAPVLASSTASIQDTGWLAPAQGWLVQASRLFWSGDAGQTWLERTPAGASIRLAAFSDADSGWALETPFPGGARLYQTQDGGAHWEAFALPVSEASWQPLQLHWDATSGTIVLRRATSAAFDLAVLLRSSDGGRSWQPSDLPTSGAVSFTSLNDGWLEAQRFPAWYHTSDGGLTWQAALAKTAPPAVQTAALPGAENLEGEIVLSGSDGSRLAWAVTRRSACQGEKLSPGFACTQSDQLWLTRDGGLTWQAAALPASMIDGE